MDWKIFASTFITIFIAELGDKTQFAAVAASTGTDKKFTVLIAVVSALALAGAIGVALGSILGQWLNPDTMRWVSGTLFVAVGAWILLKP